MGEEKSYQLSVATTQANRGKAPEGNNIVRKGDENMKRLEESYSHG